MEFPEGVGFTDASTIPGEEAFTTGARAGGTFDLPLTEIHEHLAPYHAMQIEDFVGALREDREPAVTGRDAIRSLEIIQAIYVSSRTGTTVELAHA
jgi:predicted dehydrogenase